MTVAGGVERVMVDRVRWLRARGLGAATIYQRRRVAGVEVATWLTLAGYAGLRWIEVAHFRCDDLRRNDGHHLLHLRGKGARDRLVPATRLVMAQLQRWGTRGVPWMFPRRYGRPGPRTSSIVSQIAIRDLNSVGLEATMHQARHRFATRLYEETHDVVLVQRMLGHASLKATQRYVGRADTDAATAVELITGRAAP